MERLIKNSLGQWDLVKNQKTYIYNYVGDMGEQGGHTYSVHDGTKRIGLIHHVGTDEQGGWIHPAHDSEQDRIHDEVSQIHNTKSHNKNLS